MWGVSWKKDRMLQVQLPLLQPPAILAQHMFCRGPLGWRKTHTHLYILLCWTCLLYAVVQCSSNTLCSNVNQCCHYNGTIAGAVSLGTCDVTAASCDANGLALSGASAWFANQACGGGMRGSGVCANGAGCCSPLGYCGTGTLCTTTTYAHSSKFVAVTQAPA